MSLHIKYRPKDFNEFIGNRGVILTLKSLFEREQKDIPQAFLFTGQRGCGKTTLARILKDKLECSDYDFKEINTANNRGIDTARDIISSVNLQPLSGKVKVYLFDEFHMTTKEHQNALLKIVEEPPAYVYFMFCTTEPDKIISPLKSRCSHIEVNLLGNKKIKRIITNICEKENIEIEEGVIDEIIKGAEGSPREALVILDLIRDIEKIDNQIETVKSHNIKNDKNIIELCRAFLEPYVKWKKISGILKNIDDEPERVRRAVLGYFSKVLLSENPHVTAAVVIECFSNNFYDSGKAGLVLACYEVLNI